MLLLFFFKIKNFINLQLNCTQAGILQNLNMRNRWCFENGKQTPQNLFILGNYVSYYLFLLLPDWLLLLREYI